VSIGGGFITVAIIVQSFQFFGKLHRVWSDYEVLNFLTFKVWFKVFSATTYEQEIHSHHHYPSLAAN